MVLQVYEVEKTLSEGIEFFYELVDEADGGSHSGGNVLEYIEKVCGVKDR